VGDPWHARERAERLVASSGHPARCARPPRSDQREREASFQRSIRSWPLEANGGRVLRRNALGITVRHLSRFNAHQQQKTPNAFSELVDAALDTDAGPVPAAARKIDDWASTRFARADALAKRYQRVSRLLDYSIYALAAVSVIVAAIRAIWTAPGSAPALVLSIADIFILLTISVIVVGDLRGRLRDGWICFRAMAEYLRTYMFFALVEPRKRAPAGEEHRSLTGRQHTGFCGYRGPWHCGSDQQYRSRSRASSAFCAKQGCHAPVVLHVSPGDRGSRLAREPAEAGGHHGDLHTR
jgi:hypothetical protein